MPAPDTLPTTGLARVLLLYRVVGQAEVTRVGRLEQRTGPLRILAGHRNLNSTKPVDRQPVRVSQRFALHLRRNACGFEECTNLLRVHFAARHEYTLPLTHSAPLFRDPNDSDDSDDSFDLDAPTRRLDDSKDSETPTLQDSKTPRLRDSRDSSLSPSILLPHGEVVSLGIDQHRKPAHSRHCRPRLRDSGAEILRALHRRVEQSNRLE